MSSCPATGKVRHRTKAGAAAAARHEEGRQPGGRIAAYRCPGCGDWHIGHTDNRPKKRAHNNKKPKKRRVMAKGPKA